MAKIQFDEFYRALHDRDPFPWQRRFAIQILATGIWPKVINLPTGSGKTSLLDLAVFALASDASRNDRAIPRRIFYVVDRRLIVDSTFLYAVNIAQSLKEASSGILREVADRLRALSKSKEEQRSSETEPLHVSMLRGGMYREDSWARSPVQPVICVSTVDQVGSRLLFRGYGVSSRNWPIHAGLVGTDSLVILDEAHISQPFAQTIEHLMSYAGPKWREQSIGNPLEFVKMTATPANEGGNEENTFRLNSEDEGAAVLARRLNANKWASLEKFTDDEENPERNGGFVRKIRDLAYGLVWPSPTTESDAKKAKKNTSSRKGDPEPEVSKPNVVGIVVNRVATARAVFEAIQSDISQGRGCQVILLTGRVRPYDRDELLYQADNQRPHSWLEYIKADENRPRLDIPVFVVATQTIEVGADLDFDALVTEIAPLDVLKQRFGRVDRLGLRQHSRSCILARTMSIARGGKDWLYQATLPATWKILESISSKKQKRKIVNLGVNALKTSIESTDSDILSPSLSASLNSHAPVLLPAHVDALCQTNPRPAAEPDVATLLHGEESQPADVQIVWREGLTSVRLSRWDENKAEDSDEVIRTLGLLPPTSIEALSLPFVAARRWLESKTGQDISEAEIADVEGRSMAGRASSRNSARGGYVALRWRGPKKSGLIRANELHPGDTVIVPSTFGGLDRYGWVPLSNDPVTDVSEPCNRIARRRLLLRVRRHRPLTWLNISEESQQFSQELRELLDEAESTEELSNLRSDVAKVLARAPSPLPWAREVVESRGKDLTIVPDLSGDGWIISNSMKLKPFSQVFETGNFDDFTGDDDDSSLQRASQKVELRRHMPAVARLIDSWAVSLALPDTIRNTLVASGGLHDLGKADFRFLTYLCGGSELAAYAEAEPLAKSSEGYLGPTADKVARKRAGLPEGFRHEALSVAMIANSSIGPRSGDLDSLLYFVGSHHGYGRPLLRAVNDSETEPATFAFALRSFSALPNHNLHSLDQGWPERFWRVVGRFGSWGAAYLESILRLADHRISEKEQAGDLSWHEAGEDIVASAITPASASAKLAHSPQLITLGGLKGENPLGILASLGLLRVLSRSLDETSVAMRWVWQGTWKPEISVPFSTPEQLIEILARGLTSENAVATFLNRNLVEYKDLTIPVTVFRDLISEAVLSASRNSRFATDALAALGSDMHPTDKELISDTALRTMSGAGHQHFLGSMRDLSKEVQVEQLNSALFRSWRYEAELPTLRWDPMEDRRYALRAENPSHSATLGVPGANRLAFEALPLFPVFPGLRSAVTNGFHRRDGETIFSWPIWDVYMSLSAVQSLLGHQELSAEKPREQKLKPLGVAEVFRSSRITIGKFRNFTPSMPCWGSALVVAVGA